MIVDAADCMQCPAHLAFWMSSCRLNSQQMLATGWTSENGISGKSSHSVLHIGAHPLAFILGIWTRHSVQHAQRHYTYTYRCSFLGYLSTNHAAMAIKKLTTNRTEL